MLSARKETLFVIDVTHLLSIDKNIKRLIHAGFNQNYLWRIKNGRRGVSHDALIKIERMLRLSKPIKDTYNLWSPYPNKLYYFMQVKKIDASKIASKTELSSETIRKIISGTILPGKSAIRKICRTLYLNDKKVFPYYYDHIKQRRGLYGGH